MQLYYSNKLASSLTKIISFTMTDFSYVGKHRFLELCPKLHCSQQAHNAI